LARNNEPSPQQPTPHAPLRFAGGHGGAWIADDGGGGDLLELELDSEREESRAGCGGRAAQRTRITMRALKDSLLFMRLHVQPKRALLQPFLADSERRLCLAQLCGTIAKIPFRAAASFGDLDVRRLSFTVENGPDSKKQTGPCVKNPLLMDPDKEEMEHPLILANDVNKFIVEFIDPQTGDWTSEWTRTNQLPLAKSDSRWSLAVWINFSSEAQEAMIGTVALPAPSRPA